MLHINIVAVGKIKEDYLRKGIAEYQKRLRAYTKLQIIEVPDFPLGRDLAWTKQEEGKKINAILKAPSFVAVCDPRGRKITSEDLAQWLATREREGKTVNFVVGGAAGLDPQIVARADDRLSFSALTFPSVISLTFIGTDLPGI